MSYRIKAVDLWGRCLSETGQRDVCALVVVIGDLEVAHRGTSSRATARDDCALSLSIRIAFPDPCRHRRSAEFFHEQLVVSKRDSINRINRP